MESYKRLQAAHEDYTEWLDEVEERVGFKPDISFEEFCQTTGWFGPSFSNYSRISINF